MSIQNAMRNEASYRSFMRRYHWSVWDGARWKPPENELQKGGERVMSEHQLRVQRSLQKLNVPDWYKNSSAARTPEGFLLKNQHKEPREGWPGLSSKTTSLSSLGSTQSAATARSPTIDEPPTCPSSSHSVVYPLVDEPPLALVHLTIQQVPNLSEVRTSIKEVTSAIVHYVSGVRDGSGEALGGDSLRLSSRSSSPRGSGRLCWLESSFVGTRPLDSPETPADIDHQALDGQVDGKMYLELTKMPYTTHQSTPQQQQVNGEYLLT
uniref:Uncharacterized protein n=1 Tax=Timema genevievae TaxID=629358 RepID=A0A7R9PPW5_TIMGE|nr:unnamed protein product [Timema genevievae]